MNDFEIKGVNIRLNKKLSPTKIKGKGFINAVDISKEEEERIKKLKFEMLCRAFEDLPKPKPAMCRCMLEPKELQE